MVNERVLFGTKKLHKNQIQEMMKQAVESNYINSGCTDLLADKFVRAMLNIEDPV